MGLKLEDLVLYAVTDTSWLRGQTLVQQVSRWRRPCVAGSRWYSFGKRN